MCPTLSEKLRGCQHHGLDETHTYTGPGTGRGTVFLGGSTSFSHLLSETDTVQLHHHSGHGQGNGSEEGLSQTWNFRSMSPQLQCELLPVTNRVTLAERGHKRDLTLLSPTAATVLPLSLRKGAQRWERSGMHLARAQLAPVPQGNSSPTRQQKFPAPPAFPTLAICSGSAIPAAGQ